MKINLDFKNLLELIEELEQNGIPREEWNNFEFELNYDNCFYESDRPDLVCIRK